MENVARKANGQLEIYFDTNARLISIDRFGINIERKFCSNFEKQTYSRSLMYFEAVSQGAFKTVFRRLSLGDFFVCLQKRFLSLRNLKNLRKALFIRIEHTSIPTPNFKVRHSKKCHSSYAYSNGRALSSKRTVWKVTLHTSPHSLEDNQTSFLLFGLITTIDLRCSAEAYQRLGSSFASGHTGRWSSEISTNDLDGGTGS